MSITTMTYFVEIPVEFVPENEMKRLRAIEAAAERVVWFDWSGNDPDAVTAIEALREALPKMPTNHNLFR